MITLEAATLPMSAQATPSAATTKNLRRLDRRAVEIVAVTQAPMREADLAEFAGAFWSHTARSTNPASRLRQLGAPGELEAIARL
jgi:hypothetical protein